MKIDNRLIRRSVFSLIGVTAVMCVAGCAEEVTNLFRGSDNVEVTAAFAPSLRALTRAADGLNINTTGFSTLTSDNASSKVCVKVDDGAGNYTTYDYSITGATEISPSGSTSPTFPAAVDVVHAYGWYPYNSGNTSFSIQPDQSTTAGYCLSDLMLANRADCNRSGSGVTPATLTFRHVMAKVVVNISLGSGVTVTAVTLHGIQPTVTIDESDVTSLNVGDASGTPGTVTLLTGGNVTALSNPADRTFAAVFPEQTVSGSFLTVATELNGTPSTITYSFQTGSKTFAKSYEYTMNISIDATQTGSPTVNIDNWQGAEGSVDVVIGGHAPTLTPDHLELTYGGEPGVLTPSGIGTSWIGVSDNDNIAEVTENGTTITVNPVNAGETTVFVFPVSGVTGGFSSANCAVLVNKAAPTLTLSTTALEVVNNSSSAFTVTRDEAAGDITANSSNEAVATTSVEHAGNVATVTVTGHAIGNATITVTKGDGTNYTAYTATDKTVDVTVRDKNMTDNPLWWVAQFNMAEGATDFVGEHSITGQYCFNFTDAATANVSGYHLPDFAEQISIVPMNNPRTGSDGTNIFGLTTDLSSPTEFSEQPSNVGGNPVAANTSIIGKKTNSDFYAIRFIGTSYCSAWHYKWVTSPCNGLLIESYLLSGVTTLSQAKAKMAEASFATTTFTGSYNASEANLSPASTAVTTNGFCQRFLPACGYCLGATGAATDGQGSFCFYWSATAKNDSNGWYWWFGSGRLYEVTGNRTNGTTVRLFRDH